MEAYSILAKFYNDFMANVPYDEWADFIDYAIRAFGVSKAERGATDPLESERNLLLDLGCGTGILTRKLYDKGYDLMGIDISEEMLDEARSLSEDPDAPDIMYICQDMCELDLYCTVGTIYSSCDSVNYLLDDMDIRECFDRVENFLYPGGIFIFDFNTVHKYRDVIGNRTITDSSEEATFIWDNYYDEEDNSNQYDLTFFIKEEDSGLYRREEETHLQRAFEVDEMCDFVREAGLKIIAVIDEGRLSDKIIRDKLIKDAAFGEESYAGINKTTERAIIIAKKDKMVQ